MRKLTKIQSVVLQLCLFIPLTALSQPGNGTITGAVKDSAGAVLQGAKVELQPQLRPITTNSQGEFTLTSVPAGTYSVTISYVGFAPYTGSVTVAPGQVATVNANLNVATRADNVEVTAERPRGDAEAINRTLAADNILQVLPADVITSLPNANIADALGRMPSVSIERDEGEGKYVQIRGTEPRLSNTMVDGVSIPSPETGVRQIKLDTIASDLVDSVEINKTLQANIDADGIGGSVNLVTKTASDAPTVSLYGLGGYTPIIGGRDVYMGGATIGRRFLADKKLGALAGFTYDYNGRGINDLEPVPAPGSATPAYLSQDFRDYIYNRTRWGATGSLDYKLNEGSDISLRMLFSTFRNWGNKWVYTTIDASQYDPTKPVLGNPGNPIYSQDWRRPNMAIFSTSLAGHHLFGNNTVLWNASVSRSRSLSGSGGATFLWLGPGNDGTNYNCINDQSIAKSVYRPGWGGTCFGGGGQPSAFDRNNYGFSEFDYPTYGQSAQLNLEGDGSYARMYHFGTHYGTVEFGAKIRNAHKYDNTYNFSYCTDAACDGAGANLLPISQHPEWNSTFHDPKYYDGTYGGPYTPVTSWGLLRGWVEANNSILTPVGGPGVNGNNYNLIERIPAGYVMNTIELHSRVRLNLGLRIEATHVDTTSFDETTNALTYKAGGDYTNILPSGSFRFALDKDSDLRLVFGRGVSRPDPQDISAAVSQPTLGQVPVTLSIGNPNLKAENANNYDILYERTFSHTGLLQLGYFYKQLFDPIAQFQFYSTANYPHVPPGTRVLVTQPINAGTGQVHGFEIGFQQRFAYMPSVLGGLGLSANYSHTGSVAHNLPGRSDSPALQRDAPDVWNIGPTYDTRKFSMRVGMSYDGAMIYQYQWQDGADPTGIRGPSGDQYLYAHFQFDTQASYNLPRGFQAYGYVLNANNEVFGFYNGSTQYMVQREYYHPTYAGGLRWNLHHE
ncbi:MAG TPA: TonB-dependent receptor [Terracidiphilus sp.]|nr:TonB-dependent receptor [Terracidiphilus sp.]